MADRLAVIPVASGPFECRGDGLLYGGIKCENPKTLKYLLLPTKSSKVVVTRDRDHSRMWWKGAASIMDSPHLHIPLSTPIALASRGLSDSVGALQDHSVLIPGSAIQLPPAFSKSLIRGLRIATDTQRKPPTRHKRTNSGSSQTKDSKKRKIDTTYHVNISQPCGGEISVPVPMTRAPVDPSAPFAHKHHDRPPVVSKKSGERQNVRKGIPGGSSGKYELDCGFGSNSRSKEKPKLYVTMLESGWFQAALLLPGFFECLIRPRTDVTVAINGYLRFEWCGWNEQAGEIVPPSAKNIGWLKIYHAEGRVKGAIQTPLGPYLIQGPRVKSGSHVIQEKWEDYS
ncbi:hypothetical protein AG1IA_02034 [Rhizoctonia solani AG-1 IA]|uniref:Uncharacterized protein n=1 Tax=Thanatephorus cucumeris (strain AG1-IA) TaxID=983506 RepID=L8X4J4_THACA|nr:hypothetical protein AG1IA_02034 [Rhizoctonia solani AG-1 IA]